MTYARFFSPFTVLLIILMTSCGTLSNGHRWGEDVSFGSWERIKAAAWNSAIDSLDLSPVTRKVLRLSAKTLAAGTAWARVEAGKHYPTDVLAGAAIGHFLTAVIHDSFMGLDEAVQLDVQVDRKEGAMLSFSWPL